MRPFEIFRTMSAEHALHFCRGLHKSAPASYAQALALAGAAMRARPVFLKKQPFERRAEAIRRGLSRVASNELAEEFLAVYFLEGRNGLLVEWLDSVGIEHEDGVLQDDEVVAPDDAALRSAVTRFLEAPASDASTEGDTQTDENSTPVRDADDRVLLLRAFSAQRSVDWPLLDTLLTPSEAS